MLLYHGCFGVSVKLGRSGLDKGGPGQSIADIESILKHILFLFLYTRRINLIIVEKLFRKSRNLLCEFAKGY